MSGSIIRRDDRHALERDPMEDRRNCVAGLVVSGGGSPGSSFGHRSRTFSVRPQLWLTPKQIPMLTRRHTWRHD